jgi:RNA polymerase sigma-70 factor (ECF subfamily)
MAHSSSPTAEKIMPNADLNRVAQAAFEELFQQHWQRLYSVIYRLTGDPAEAEDLALEAFWQLWQRPPGKPGTLAGWLYRVAVNLGYNALRSRRRRQQYEWDAGKDALQQNPPPDPARQVEASQERVHVRQVLLQLEPRQAQLIILRHVGLSYREIAAALGVAPASVGTMLLRAENAFEEQYQKEEGYACR